MIINDFEDELNLRILDRKKYTDIPVVIGEETIALQVLGEGYVIIIYVF